MKDIEDKYAKITYFINKLDNSIPKIENVNKDSIFQQNVIYQDKPNPINKYVKIKDNLFKINKEKGKEKEKDSILNPINYLYTNSIWIICSIIMDETTLMSINLKKQRAFFMKEQIRNFVYNQNFYKFCGWKRHKCIVELIDTKRINNITEYHISSLGYLISFIFSRMVIINGLECSFNNSVSNQNIINLSIENGNLRLINN